MWAPFIWGHVQRSTRNLLLTNAALVVAVAGTAAINWQYLYNFFLGPFPADVQALNRGEKPGLKYYVTLKAEKVFASGVQEISQEKGTETVQADFLIADLADHGLVLKAPPNPKKGNEFTGALVEMPLNVWGEVVKRILAERPDLQGYFLMTMLDATGFRSDGYWGLGIGLPLLALGLWNLQRAAKRRSHPEAHPIVAALQTYGQPEEVASAIEAEVMADGQRKFGAAYITGSWLLHPDFFGLYVRQLNDIAWAHMKTVKHYHTFIPTGKTFSAVILDRRGGSHEITCKEKQVEEILQELLRRAPWLVVGYDEQLQKMWTSDRAAFIQAVDERRAKWGAGLSAKTDS